MAEKSQLEKRGAAIYRLAANVKFASFKFLAVTTGIFIWAAFHSYFVSKFGDLAANVMGFVAVLVMYTLIDKGLDKLWAILFDEKINPRGDEGGNSKARGWFFRIVFVLAFIRLLATGTTSVWGSYEIGDITTNAPSDTTITNQLSQENEHLAASSSTIQGQLDRAMKTEDERVKKAKAQGHLKVDQALALHPDPRVGTGLRSGYKLKQRNGTGNWYMTTWKVKKVREAFLAAMQDSAALVHTEQAKVSDLEAALVAINTTGKASVDTLKQQLTFLSTEQWKAYQAKKTRRTHFLLIADALAIIFGLTGLLVMATYKAAIGDTSALEKKTLEGIMDAAWQKWKNKALDWLESLLGVDLDGDGDVGGVPQPVAVSQKQETGVSQGQETPKDTGPQMPHLQPVSNAGTIVAQGPSKILIDVSNAKKRVRKQWERAFTSSTETARQENRRKALKGIAELEALGYQITRLDQGKMRIEIPE